MNKPKYVPSSVRQENGVVLIHKGLLRRLTHKKTDRTDFTIKQYIFFLQLASNGFQTDSIHNGYDGFWNDKILKHSGEKYRNMFCISIFDSVEKIIQEEYQSMDSIFYKYGEDEDRDAFINARKQKKDEIFNEEGTTLFVIKRHMEARQKRLIEEYPILRYIRIYLKEDSILLRKDGNPSEDYEFMGINILKGIQELLSKYKIKCSKIMSESVLDSVANLSSKTNKIIKQGNTFRYENEIHELVSNGYDMFLFVEDECVERLISILVEGYHFLEVKDKNTHRTINVPNFLVKNTGLACYLHRMFGYKKDTVDEMVEYGILKKVEGEMDKETLSFPSIDELDCINNAEQDEKNILQDYIIREVGTLFYNIKDYSFMRTNSSSSSLYSLSTYDQAVERLDGHREVVVSDDIVGDGLAEYINVISGMDKEGFELKTIILFLLYKKNNTHTKKVDLSEIAKAMGDEYSKEVVKDKLSKLIEFHLLKLPKSYKEKNIINLDKIKFINIPEVISLRNVIQCGEYVIIGKKLIDKIIRLYNKNKIKNKSVKGFVHMLISGFDSYHFKVENDAIIQETIEDLWKEGLILKRKDKNGIAGKFLMDNIQLDYELDCRFIFWKKKMAKQWMDSFKDHFDESIFYDKIVRWCKEEEIDIGVMQYRDYIREICKK